jgi:hypothetical protein
VLCSRFSIFTIFVSLDTVERLPAVMFLEFNESHA